MTMMPNNLAERAYAGGKLVPIMTSAGKMKSLVYLDDFYLYYLNNIYETEEDVYLSATGEEEYDYTGE